MGGHVLIVDRNPARRAQIRSALQEIGLRVEEDDDPSGLAARLTRRPDLLVIALDREGDAAHAGIGHASPDGGRPFPTLALVPPGRPALRLAALRAGAEEVTDHDIAARILQARVRSLLRAREAAAALPGREDVALPMIGLAEAAATFWPSGPGAAPLGALARPRVFVMSPIAGGAGLSPDLLGRLLGADVAFGPAGPEGPPPDLIVIEATAVRGDLDQGARILAILADLRGRQATRDAATMVLLPGRAIETAALALDLGAGDVVTATVPPEEIALRACALLDRKAAAERLRAQVRSRLRAAVTDPLTGLYNLHHANPALLRLAEAARQSGDGLAVMMLDIDRFKSINDRLGHGAGDRVLAEVARRLKAHLRRSDHLARVGGEEFRAVLPGATLTEAQAIAEGLRRAIAVRPFDLDGRGDASPLRHGAAALTGTPAREAALREISVTISIGVAAATADDLAAGLTASDLVARADAALYAAKAAGRNRVVPERQPA